MSEKIVKQRHILKSWQIIERFFLQIYDLYFNSRGEIFIAEI